MNQQREIPVAVTGLPRKLGLLDSVSIVIGIVIGAGIFVVPNLVAQRMRSAAAILGVRIFAGVISFGSLACAELGTMLPSTGGQYVFLREAYGPLVGVLCEWSMFVPPPPPIYDYNTGEVTGEYVPRRPST